MSKLILIRHGEPDYTEVTNKKFVAHGRDLAGLSDSGIKQAEQVSKDERLKDADIIISSPYTRALQTASIISKNTGLDIKVELDLHEWLPDLTFTYDSSEKASKSLRECIYYKGTKSDLATFEYEEIEAVASRAYKAICKYLEYDKLVVVCHGIVLRQFYYVKEVSFCTIFETDFDINSKWKGFIEKE